MEGKNYSRNCSFVNKFRFSLRVDAVCSGHFFLAAVDAISPPAHKELRKFVPLSPESFRSSNKFRMTIEPCGEKTKFTIPSKVSKPQFGVRGGEWMRDRTAQEIAVRKTVWKLALRTYGTDHSKKPVVVLVRESFGVVRPTMRPSRRPSNINN